MKTQQQNEAVIEALLDLQKLAHSVAHELSYTNASFDLQKRSFLVSQRLKTLESLLLEDS